MQQLDSKLIDSTFIRLERENENSRLLLLNSELKAMEINKEEYEEMNEKYKIINFEFEKKEKKRKNQNQNQNQNQNDIKNDPLKFIIQSLNIPIYRKLNFYLQYCYICKVPYKDVHFFYDYLCPNCAEINYNKRIGFVDLTGNIAVVTGGRIKIGFYCALKLLRWGATVLVTTRFPHDAAQRYSKEPDFEKWKKRLHIYGSLDFRDLRRVEIFCEYLKVKFKKIDILVNNSAQTVWKPPLFYQHLKENEQKSFHLLPDDSQKLVEDYHTSFHEFVQKKANFYHQNESNYNIKFLEVNKELKQEMEEEIIIEENENKIQIQNLSLPILEEYQKKISLENNPQFFPDNEFDLDQQQIDLRRRNSWYQRLEEIATFETLEVVLVNSLAPFLFVQKLKPIMEKPKESQESSFIINVTAIEGNFYIPKPTSHPHTNMAKTGMNMITHTLSQEFSDSRIFMNSVDPGWVSDQAPYHVQQNRSENSNSEIEWSIPLDYHDGASRVLDPIFLAHFYKIFYFGKLFKDYRIYNW
ncbi:oxidoreductase-like protein [Anaeramoeba ignava]|uniref:Oxidoreductase-like protein n=1 Tax=Anaeramoeba ignava TaxID=1746090 RepID=A0A9Q0LTX0_ANAIG|nr:oxidoreductase-like protein [Anaeramoeba ignava]